MSSIKSYLSLNMELMVEMRISKSDAMMEKLDKTERPWPMVQKGFNRFFDSKKENDEKKVWRKLQGFVVAELPKEKPKGSNCVIGKGVVLGKNVVLNNAVLMDGVEICFDSGS